LRNGWRRWQVAEMADGRWQMADGRDRSGKSRDGREIRSMRYASRAVN
jgi:hypothetical protein